MNRGALAMLALAWGAGCGDNASPIVTFEVDVTVPTTITKIVVDGDTQTIPTDDTFVYMRTYATSNAANDADEIEFDFYDGSVVQDVGFAQANVCTNQASASGQTDTSGIADEVVIEGVGTLDFAPIDWEQLDCTFHDGTSFHDSP